MSCLTLVSSLAGFILALPGPTVTCPAGTRRVVKPSVGVWCVSSITKLKHGPAAYHYRRVPGKTRLQTKARGRFANGRREGLWVQWYRGGVKWKEETYRRGVLHGTTRLYHPSGRLATRGTFTRGVADGKWTFFDKHGRKTLDAVYRKGKKAGTWTWYYPHSGRKRLVHFYFGRWCYYSTNYSEGGQTGFWEDNVWYGKGVVGGDFCIALWKRKRGGR
jgi:hypothetical protein